MEAVKKKWFWGILLSILTIFAMSHNVNAATTVLDLSNFTKVRGSGTLSTTCTWSGGSNISSGNTCTAMIDGRTRLLSITVDASYENKEGDLVNFFLFVYNSGPSSEYNPKINLLSSTGAGWDVIDYHVVDSDDYFRRYGGDGGYINWSPNNDFNINFQEYGYYYKIYDITLRARNDGNYAISLTAGNNGLYEFNTSDTGTYVNFALRNYTQYRFSGDAANKEVEEKTQSAVDDSEAAGGSSSQDAQTGTTGLLNAITGAVNVIAAASPTNCKINGNMGNLDMGQLDLCANPAPVFIQTIGSLILILMCVPLAISLFNRFIAIFRSFQS